MKKRLFLMLMIAGTQVAPALAQYGDGPYITCVGHESWWDQVIQAIFTGTSDEWEWDTSRSGGRCCQGSAAGSLGVHTTVYSMPEGDGTYSIHYDYESVPVSECQANGCGNLVEGY